MATPSEKLADSLVELRKLQEDGKVAIQSEELSRTHRERLVENMAGRPIPYALHSLITTLLSGIQSQVWAYTDSAGHCKGLVPRNAPLRLEVLNDCYTLAYAKELGQLTQKFNDSPVSSYYNKIVPEGSAFL